MTDHAGAVIEMRAVYKTAINRKERARFLLTAVGLAAACTERLVQLSDGAVFDDIDLTGGYPVEGMIRRVGQPG
jgi:hypothetical protein